MYNSNHSVYIKRSRGCASDSDVGSPRRTHLVAAPIVVLLHLREGESQNGGDSSQLPQLLSCHVHAAPVPCRAVRQTQINVLSQGQESFKTKIKTTAQYHERTRAADRAAASSISIPSPPSLHFCWVKRKTGRHCSRAMLRRRRWQNNASLFARQSGRPFTRC